MLKAKSPFVPDLANDWDPKYFDSFQEQEAFYPGDSTKKKFRKVTLL